MFSRQNEQVIVRLLSDGKSQEAVFERLEGRHLQLRMPDDDRCNSFRAGDLVEVNSPKTLYLGEIAAKESSILRISVEHALDRETLAAIHQVWTRPDVA